MDVLTLAATLLRRWYVLLPVLLLTAGGVTYVALTAEPEWEMRGSFLMTSDPALAGIESDDPGAGAPEADDDEARPALGSIDPVLLAERLQSGEVRERVADAGGGADYTVTVEDALMRVTASSQERDAVVPTVTGVFDELERELSEHQDARDVPEERRYSASAVNTPTDASIRAEAGGEDAPTTYTASGSVRLVNPRGEAGQTNPYAESHVFTVQVLAEVLRGDAAMAALEQRGATGDFDVSYDGGILTVEAFGESGAEAQATFEGALEIARQELDRRQDAYDVPASERLDLYELSVPPAPTPQDTDLLRPMLMLAGLGGAAAVGLALLADNLATGLRRRRGDAYDPDVGTADEDALSGSVVGAESGIEFDGRPHVTPLEDEAGHDPRLPGLSRRG